MAQRPPRRSSLAMMVLALLAEEPMHPYRMQQLIRERAKDSVVNVAQRTSVYQTVERLVRDGLVAVAGTVRDERRPERTVYRLTDEGRATLDAWLRTMLSTPAREFPEFPAALAVVPLLPPADVAQLLRTRVERLEAALADLEAAMAAAPELPRLFLLEDEYRAALLRVERDWVQGLVSDLEAGAVTWDGTWLREVQASLRAAGVGADR